MPFTTYGRQQTLNWVTDNGDAPPGQLWVKLHVGDPGIDAADNGAVETDRVQATFGPANGSGQSTNVLDMDWLTVAASEIYTHVSIWDAASGGNPWYTGQLTNPVPVTVGSDFRINTGQAVIQHT